MKTLLSEFGKVILTVQEAVPWVTRKKDILQGKISSHSHGVRFSNIVIKERPLMVIWCSDLREQGLELCAVGDNQAAPIYLQSLGL